MSIIGKKAMVKVMAIAAPRAAPDESPRMDGEAMGLRNTACITAPAMLSPAPTTQAMVTRGRFICCTMMTLVSEPIPNSASSASLKLNGMNAWARSSTMKMNKRTNSAAKTVMVRFRASWQRRPCLTLMEKDEKRVC